ncbi:uncharacterized protein F4807DRAFT_104982 [Annulohypoxylon truncatum]|uniref:uncharacterized protein n=1 Tax=Annulohypoxylon truncatum TaxID=327061 RepID=UPI0020080229|nr:uncharacterized protein F4807DRAFT_104982 [Annulohypoxylon truncatum]KAI1208948.1 hypothetical protein F4807DRAFT_104982 [Annulohypoxylon truncatum]
MDSEDAHNRTAPEDFTVVENPDRPMTAGERIFIPYSGTELDETNGIEGDDDEDETESDEGEDDDDDDELDDGEPDFVVGGSNTIDIRTERTKLLTDVSKEARFDDPETLERYRARVRLCLKDDKNAEEPTLLHYIVLSILIFHESHEAMNFIVKLTLEESPGDLACQTKGPLETPLHVAIKRKEEKLAQLMCESAPTIAEKAISLQNENGETCLHLAIKENLDIVPYLIKKAHVVTFRQQRSQKLREGAGNTPLHDAVHYSRYIAEAATCPPEKIPKCRRCREAEKKLESSSIQLRKIVEALVERDAENLATLNALGQSPYVYYLTTRQEVRATLDLAKQKSTGASQERSPKNPKVEKDKTTVSSKPEKPKANVRSASNGSGEEGKRLKNPKSENPKSESPDPSQSKARPLKPGPKISKSHQRLPRSDKLAEKTKVEEYLREMAFAQGNFEKACKCLFGNRSADSKVRTVFRPQLRLSEHTPEDHEFLEFGKMLAYVELDIRPRPFIQGTGSVIEDELEGFDTWEEDSKALCATFQWLRKKNVKQIVKLVVKDNPDRNCSDETIESCLDGFDVRYLDWNKADMCVDTIRKKAPNVVHLWLHSSGSNAVLWSWSDSNGLRSLPKLNQVYLNARKGLESYKRNEENVRTFKERLRQPINSLESSKIKVIESIEKPPKARPHLRLENSFDARSQDRHQWMNNIRDFAAELRTELGVNYTQRKPKVAIIDDGVNPESEFLGQRIAHGWPPDEPKSSSEPFYASTKGHGTQMAKLICHACPFAQLYVAKLDGWKDPDLPHPQFTAKDAAEAVKWAIRENVDIISMSWNIERNRSNEADIDALASQIKVAANRNIIMYCAAQDKGQLGNSEVEVYPAGSDTTKLRIVGAADPTGHPLNIVDTDKVHYLFPGEVVLENDGKTITGSSAATALAAGTAAMILFCYELGYGKMETIAKPARMGQLFNSLKTTTKFVDVEPILKPGNTPQFVVKECTARVKEIRDEENQAIRTGSDQRNSGVVDVNGSTASFTAPIRRTTGPLVTPVGR